jgi:hypothetical protein
MTGFFGCVGAGAAAGVDEEMLKPAKSAKSLFEDGAGLDAGGLEIKAKPEEVDCVVGGGGAG